jgi:hypothetical protein
VFEQNHFAIFLRKFNVWQVKIYGFHIEIVANGDQIVGSGIGFVVHIATKSLTVYPQFAGHKEHRFPQTAEPSQVLAKFSH